MRTVVLSDICVNVAEEGVCEVREGVSAGADAKLQDPVEVVPAHNRRP